MGWRGFGWRYLSYPRGWWCPRHPWPPAWARAWYPWYWYPHSVEPSEELKILEDLRKELQRELSTIEKRLEELRKSIGEKSEKG